MSKEAHAWFEAALESLAYVSSLLEADTGLWAGDFGIKLCAERLLSDSSSFRGLCLAPAFHKRPRTLKPKTPFEPLYL